MYSIMLHCRTTRAVFTGRSCQPLIVAATAAAHVQPETAFLGWAGQTSDDKTGTPVPWPAPLLQIAPGTAG